MSLPPSNLDGTERSLSGSSQLELENQRGCPRLNRQHDGSRPSTDRVSFETVTGEFNADLATSFIRLSSTNSSKRSRNSAGTLFPR